MIRNRNRELDVIHHAKYMLSGNVYSDQTNDAGITQFCFFSFLAYRLKRPLTGCWTYRNRYPLTLGELFTDLFFGTSFFEEHLQNLTIQTTYTHLYE